ncbi:MAG: SLC13 family permease, partial [Myxococcota bacterium]
MHLWLALAIFGLTYAVISGRSLPGLRLDRPSVVLLGSVLMVASGILTPERAYASIHLGTLGLLLGMMVLNVYLQRANFFEWAAWHVLRHARNPKRLLHLTMWVSGVLSALLVNDTVCLMLTPLVVRVWLGAGLNPLPGLLALSMGSNIGSAVTLTGNPQLMIIGQLSELPYLRYALLSLPSGVVGMWSGGWVLQQCFRAALSEELTPPTTEAPPKVDRRLLWPSLLVLVGVAVGFLLNLDLAWTALAGAALLLPVGGLAPDKVLAEVDWSLLLFFSGLFIVMGGVGDAGLTA